MIYIILMILSYLILVIFGFYVYNEKLIKFYEISRVYVGIILITCWMIFGGLR